MVGCVAVGKLIVTPLIGLLATLALRHAGWVMDDPLFSFVLIMQGTSPSATVLVPNPRPHCCLLWVVAGCCVLV